MLEVVNRATAPALKAIGELDIPHPEKFVLTNGIPVYVLNELQRDISRIDFIFNAGRWFEEQHLVAKMCNLLLREGTASYTSKELAEELDFFGASIKLTSDGDLASLTLSGLNQYLDKVIPLAEEVIQKPAFLEEELKIKRANYKQRLRVNLQKHDYLADQDFHKVLYGVEHPYGYGSAEEDYDRITTTMLKAFHRQHYTPDNCAIVVVGRSDGELIPLLEKSFGHAKWAPGNNSAPDHTIEGATVMKHRLDLPGSYQAAIRVGRRLFNKTHPDYYKMYFLNTVFGGYFGSRLMNNIREDKGYTYGIYSSISNMLHDGYFYISTEVGLQVADASLQEIYSEMQRLKEETISDDEMELVRNYLLGRLVSGLDGSFKLANIFKGLMLYGLDWDEINKMIEITKTVTAEELRNLANQYFDRDKMHEVVIG